MVLACRPTGPRGREAHNSIAWGWGFGVTMGVYVSARVSGAHLNPAVTIALAAFKVFEWGKVAPYCLAQTAGAFVAGLIVRVTYADQIATIDPDHTKLTQGIWSTSPGVGVSIPTAFLDQVVGTAVLVFVIFAMTTALNNPPLANTGPLMIGLLVVGIGMAWGTNAGYAINPAQDFGPRLASMITGYGDSLFSANGPELYFWLPIVAPLVGGLLGGLLFSKGIEPYLGHESQDITVGEPTAQN